ncbi:MAG: hypothetical protein JO252_08850 [Planctomycetaceae bacterium]|nr:hypothetical protein [Planctomycetaceae bacterium]
MLRTKSAWTLALAALLALAPWGGALAGHWLFRDRAVGTAPTGTAVYPSAYYFPNTRPLYLSNYAGSNYPRVGQGPVLNPTSYSLKTGLPRGYCLEGAWVGH